MALSSCEDVRIGAPIPGKSLVGDQKCLTLRLRRFLSVSFGNSPRRILISSWKVPLSKAVDGSARETFDLGTGLPHLLVAGSTGSGKSVCDYLESSTSNSYEGSS